MTGTTIHLVRHGEVYNPTEVFYGRLDGFSLSDEGCDQIRMAARWFWDKPAAAVYSSPMMRTYQSASIIAAAQRVDEIIRSDLITEVYTPYDGRPRAVMYEIGWDIYANSEPPYEQPADVVARARRFLDETRVRHAGEEIIAVTHGDIIALLMLWAHGAPLDARHSHRLRRLGFADNYPERASICSFHYESAAEDEMPRVEYHRAER